MKASIEKKFSNSKNHYVLAIGRYIDFEEKKQNIKEEYLPDSNIINSTHIIQTKAVFSECENYRYSLSRRIMNVKGKITYIMFNPNIRDDLQLGQTANFCFNYAVEQGYGVMEIVNLFALRSKSIEQLKGKVKNEKIDPIGADNNFYIINAINSADKVVLAWGAEGGFKRRDKFVLDMLKERPIFCFGKTFNGKPLYPKKSIEVKLVNYRQ